MKQTIKEFKGRFGFNISIGQDVALTSEGIEYAEDCYNDKTKELLIDLIKLNTFRVVGLRHDVVECLDGYNNCTCGLYIDVVDIDSGVGIKDLMFNETKAA